MWLEGYMWTVYVIQEKVTFEGSSYNHKECGVLCDLHSSKCDFFIINELDCYLATYSQESGSLVDSTANYKTYHQSGPLNSYVDEKYWTWSDNAKNWAKFLYNKFGSVYRQKCAFTCFFDTQCDFYVHWNGNCWFGNMTITDGTKHTGSTEAVEIYFKSNWQSNNGFVSAQFDWWTGNTAQSNALMHPGYYRHAIYATYQDEAWSNCPRRCITSYKFTCNFFLYHEGHCQLGDWNRAENKVHGFDTLSVNTGFYHRKDTSMYQC